MKESEPMPLLVFVVKVTVGFGLVLQQTPLTVITDWSSEIILPPLIAVVLVIFEMALVDKIGKVKFSAF